MNFAPNGFTMGRTKQKLLRSFPDLGEQRLSGSFLKCSASRKQLTREDRACISLSQNLLPSRQSCMNGSSRKRSQLTPSRALEISVRISCSPAISRWFHPAPQHSKQRLSQFRL